MAIDTYAKSLISDVRKQNKQKERDALKSSFGLLAGKLIGKGVKSFVETNLEKKKNAFLQNEQLLATKLKYKSAINSGAAFIQDQNKINEAGGDSINYFYEKMKPFYEERLKTELDPTISGNERLFGQAVYDNLMPLAKQRAEEHEKGLEIAQGLGTFKDFNTTIDNKIKAIAPTNIIDATVNSVSNMFSGKTKAEQEMEILKAIQSGQLSKNADVMIAFNERYKETKDVLKSYDYATLLTADTIEKIAAEESDITVNTKNEYKQLGDTTALVTTTETTDKVTGNVNTTVSKQDIAEQKDPLKVAKELQSINNITNLAKDLLTPPAFSDFAKTIQDNNLNLFNIKSPTEYHKISSYLSQYSSNKNNLKDPFKDNVILATLADLDDSSLNIATLEAELAGMDNLNSPEAIKTQKELQGLKVKFSDLSVIIAEETLERKNIGIGIKPDPTTTTTTTTTIPNIRNIPDNTWNSLSDLRKQKINLMPITQLQQLNLL